MINYIKTKTDDLKLTKVDSELYLSNNLEVSDDDNDEKEVTFQLYEGKLIIVVPGVDRPLTVEGIQLQLFREFINQVK